MKSSAKTRRSDTAPNAGVSVRGLDGSTLSVVGVAIQDANYEGAGIIL